MRRLSFACWLTLPLLVVGLAACDGDDGPTETAPGATYDLTFTGDNTFQSAHGDQTIHAGVREATGVLVASNVGTVSSTDDPSFSFTFTDALEEGESYDLEYWIDSNFGEDGAEDVCDAPSVDHQWHMDIGTVMNDVTIDDTHRPTETEDVCSDGDTGDNGGDGPGY